MEIFKSQEYISMENPTPGESYRPEILTKDQNAENLGGMFGLLPPGTQVPYHYHKERESLIMIISGEATEIVEGKETTIKAGDVLFIPAMEKHMVINNSEEDLRYLEFFTCPPLTSDFVAVE